MKNIIISAIILFMAFTSSFALEKDVQVYLDMIANGRVDEVKRMLPEMIAVNPDDPGVKLLHAVVLDDADVAFRMYREITDNYPESSWADDAYWRVIQYYAVSGDHEKARSELNKMKSQYPDSPYLLPAYEIIKVTESMDRKVRNQNAGIAGDYRYEEQEDIKVSEGHQQIKISKKPSQVVLNPDDGDNTATVSDSPPVSDEVIGESHVYEPPNTYKIENEGDKIYSEEDDLTVVSMPDREYKPEAESEPEYAEGVEEDISEVIEGDEEVTEVATENELAEEKEKRFNVGSAEPESRSRSWGLQVASYRNKETAEAAMKKYLAKRMKTQVITKEINGEVLYAVVIGHYQTKSRAEDSKFIVKEQCKCDPIVIQK